MSYLTRYMLDTVAWNGFNTKQDYRLQNQNLNATIGQQDSKEITTYRKNHVIKSKALTIKFNKPFAML